MMLFNVIWEFIYGKDFKSGFYLGLSAKLMKQTGTKDVLLV